MSIPLWAAQYVGVPFKEKGRDRAGWDCWGCVRAVLEEQRGIVLPSYTEGYATVRDREEIATMMRGETADHWTAIASGEARMFDGIALRILGLPTHFGLVVDPPWFLHACSRTGTGLERWDSLLWQRRLMGFVRWHP